MKKQNVGLKGINSSGYNVIATVYQTNGFKAGIKFDNNGKLLVIHEGRVICSFHVEESKNDEGKVSAAFSQKEYEGYGEVNKQNGICDYF